MLANFHQKANHLGANALDCHVGFEYRLASHWERLPAVIIYGTKPKSTRIDEGTFFCPVCEAERTYDLFSVRTYFTLYFIPLFPVGSGDEHIQCENCSGTFASELIDYDPEAEQAATAETLRRICALFLYDMGRISTTT